MSVARVVVRYRDRAQGRGVRPAIARIAGRHALTGAVRNSPEGVLLALEGERFAIDRALDEVRATLGLDERERCDESPRGARAFVIAESASDGAPSLGSIALDRRTCERCLREFDGEGRRGGYALISCAECGPRFSVIESLPFDRERTTMRAFEPCSECATEYRSLDDRRAHAQLIACPRCGPRYRAIGFDGDAMAVAIDSIRRGQIVALLGVGGFQLLCDGASREAVRRLRQRKRRPDKPFALLVRDLASAEALAWLSADERAALSDEAGPIVLVRSRAAAVIDEVAPGLSRVGLMLPTTAAHAQIARAIDGPVVCTSGNAQGEPIASSVEEGLARLATIADVFVVHDRPIAHRLDDSVVQVVAGRARVRRSGRGMGPRTYELGGPDRLCVGAHWDAAPVLVARGTATQWPHVGAMDSRLGREAFERAVRSMVNLCTSGDFSGEVLCDAHPDYATTLFAERVTRAPRTVLHHHAHIAAVLAEHGARSALGVAWDGTGLGPDGSLAGGEFIDVGEQGARWIARMRAFSLPGGEAASRDARRSCVGALREIEADDRWSRALLAQHERWPAGPKSTSVGRLFDAVSYALGLCERSTYEGHAAMLLESLCEERDVAPYPFALRGAVVDWADCLRAVIADRDRPALAATRFHRTLVAMIEAVVHRAGASVVALGGGCFNNATLVEQCVARLSAKGVTVLAAERAPSGDGAIALGQAWVSATEGRARVHRAK